MGLKIKNPIKQLTRIFNPVQAAISGAIDPKVSKRFMKDSKSLGQSNIDVFTGLGQGDLGKSMGGVSNTFSTVGQMTGMVQRPEDKPQMPGLDEAGIETPNIEKVTEDANDDVRKRLGGRFASSLLFGGRGGGGSTRTSSSSLLGF